MRLRIWPNVSRRMALLGLGLIAVLHGRAANEPDAAVSGAGTGFALPIAAPQTAPARGGFDPDVILPPAWAFGVLHGYYTNQAGILRNLQRLEAGDFPVDAIWVDSSFWDLTTKGPKGYLDFVGDQQAFPDLRRLTRELERRQIRFGIWVWDRILDANAAVYAEFEHQGYFKPGQISGNGWHNLGLTSRARTVDFSKPGAAALWTAKLQPFMAAGVDFFKIDSDSATDYLRVHFEMSQRYGRHTQGRGFVLSQCNRDSLADIKRFPAAWTGDAQASWDQADYPDTKRWILGGLRQQVEMVANPTWRHYQYPFLANDTGGFHAPTLSGRALEELYTRWVQFSAFNSMMQVFGAPSVLEQNAPFVWPPPVQENFRKYTHLRLRLFPYLYTHALLTRLAGGKLVQGEPGHPLQYRFGDAFLVAPVCEPGATHRTVWLPPDAQWVDYWTGATYAGGQEVTVPAPLDRLPLLVRAGAIIPMRDYAPSVLRGSNARLTLEVYPEATPAQSQFTLYEDDGTSNGYLTNEFSATRLTCETLGAGVRLRVEAIQGNFPGRMNQRRWQVQMHLPHQPEAVTLNGRNISWRYEPRSGIVRFTWKTLTTQSSEVMVTGGRE